MRGVTTSVEMMSKVKRLDTSKGNFFVHISQLKLTQPQWLIEDILEEESLIGLIGSSGSGKSFLAIDMACSIASGMLFHGRATTLGTVLYVASEGKRGLTARVETWCHKYGISSENLDLHISKQKLLMHDNNAVRDVLNEANLIGNVRLIIIDTLARSFGGHNENSTQDMNHFISNCDKLKAEQRSIMIVHHSGHSAERARGNSAFYAALDAELSVKKTNRDIAVKCTKMKDAPEFDAMNFLLVQTKIERDHQVFQSCHLEETTPLQKPAKLTESENLGLETLRSGTSGNVPSGSVHLDNWRLLFYEGHAGDNDEAKRKAFQRVRKNLKDKGIIEENNDYFSIRDSGTSAGHW